jgi:putative ATP-dependent endonuclease of the OLD family
MQLVAFSVTNYRSITAAYKLPIRQSTVLIGPNNEGKSNILRALVTALEILQGLSGRRISAGRLRSFRVDGRDTYYWPHDFPISLQDKKPGGESVFDLEFRLSAQEVEEFLAEVGSNLNGTLPIRLTLGQKDPGFRVAKKGPGGAALSKKAEKIASFVAKRININYIPAVRTAEAAEEIVSRMVERQLSAVEKEPAFQAALAQVAKLQQPLLDQLSSGIRDTLREFLPNVKQVKVSIPQEARYRALRRACEIVVDDGTPTNLARKGDGVQSLAALSLMRQSSGSPIGGQQLLLAIEEPESHLHPSAIHQLKAVLNEIARSSQVIMTTHCPLFVDRTAIKSNIIVHRNKATAAKSVREIRGVLGVRASDNLQHAELILVVEGEEDRRAMRALLAQQSKVLSSALAQGTLGIESLQGGSNLSYKLSQMREALCLTHCLLDHDLAGLKASEKAIREGLLSMADVHFTVCAGMKESELEDLYDENLYSAMLLNRYGVSTQSPKFKGSAKWSDRLRDAFKHQGKPWSDQIEARVKADVGELVDANGGIALSAHRRNSFDGLVATLETKLTSIAAGKK